jgi:hypothetical protein
MRGVVAQIAAQEGVADDLIMVFVPGDKGKGYRRITKVRVESLTAPTGDSYNRIILFVDQKAGGE